MRIAIAAILVLALAGCAGTQIRVPLQPQRIDTSADPAPYASVLAALRAQPAPPATIAQLADEGVTLNVDNCRDWLRTFDVAQTQFNQNRRVFNLGTALGTTLLGVLGAAPGWVAGYGLSLTAANSVLDVESPESVFSPAPVNVGSMLIDAQMAYGDQLRADAPGLTVAQVRTRLGIMADICTITSARAIVNGAVLQTQAVHSRGGQLRLMQRAVP